MTALGYALTDSATMLRRRMLHMLRYPALTLMLAGLPVIFLLLFVYVFGGTLGAGIAGIAGPAGGRAGYVNYVVPAILLIAVAGVAQGTAISVSRDMAEGIVDRFRTMSISRGSILAGHVAGSTIQTMICAVIVIAVALLAGFRPTAGLAGWAAAAGMMAMISFAVTWLSVALGLVTDNVETASNLPMPLTLLPFLGSGFVPASSMPAGLRWFAAHQPFTPVMQTLRGLLLGTPIGTSGAVATAWCAIIAAGGYWWARALFNRGTAG